MLVTNTKVKDGDLVSVRLLTGEEVVCKLVESGEHQITISKPVSIVTNGNTLAFTDFFLSADRSVETFMINKTAIIAIAKIAKQIEDQYIQMTSSIKPATAADAALIKGLVAS